MDLIIGIIYKKDYKYGIVNYVLEQEKDNATHRKYIGYQVLYEAKYSEITQYDDNYYVLKDEKKYRLYNKKEETLSEEFNFIECINNNYFVFKNEEKFKLYNKNEEKLSEEFDSIEEIGNYYKVKKEGKFGLYEETEIIYDDIWGEEETEYSAHEAVTRRYIYGIHNGEKILIKILPSSIIDID